MQITVQFRRKRVLLDIRLIVLLAFVLVIVSGIDVYRERSYLLASIFVILFFFITYPWLWRFFCFFRFHQPALVIDKMGIQLFSVHFPSTFFIHWPEIQRISVGKYYGEECICIYPKDDRAYFGHFSPFKRLAIYIRRFGREAILFLPLSYLDTSVIELFQHISQEYINELRENNIQLLT